MDYRINLKNEHVQVRERSTLASSLMDITVDLTKEYKVTRYTKGWYYVDDFKGWVEVVNTILIRIEEGLDDDDSGDIIDPGDESKLIYDPEEIIKAINQATSMIDSSKIYFIVDNKQIVLTTLLKSLQNSLNDMQAVVKKVSNMEAIPLLDNKVDGALPVVIEDPDNKGNFIIKWSKLSFKQLSGIPIVNEIIEW